MFFSARVRAPIALRGSLQVTAADLSSRPFFPFFFFFLFSFFFFLNFSIFPCLRKEENIVLHSSLMIFYQCIILSNKGRFGSAVWYHVRRYLVVLSTFQVLHAKRSVLYYTIPKLFQDSKYCDIEYDNIFPHYTLDILV